VPGLVVVDVQNEPRQCEVVVSEIAGGERDTR
jgi:hypothetical protein